MNNFMNNCIYNYRVTTIYSKVSPHSVRNASHQALFVHLQWLLRLQVADCPPDTPSFCRK